MEVWVQESLFDGKDLEPTRSAPRKGWRASAVRQLRPASHARVTRDPAVAVSYTESTRTATDFRLGLARALATLSPEQREALRATIDSPSRRSAA